MLIRSAIIWLLCLPAASFGQYANDWVQPGQEYLKISVAEDGIYRLTYSHLSNAGMPVSSIDPRLIQIFHRGVEQAILFNHNQVPANATFEPSEYLEFFGKRNDGTLDAGLYIPATDQPHKYYNLFSDTTAYFLTWSNTAQAGKRMEVSDLVNSTNIPAETAYTRERLQVLTSDYAVGVTFLNTIQQSYFTSGEGWTGNMICVPLCPVDHEDFAFNAVTNGVPTEGQPHVELMLTGRAAVTHQYEIYAGPNNGSLRLVTSGTFENYLTQRVSADLNWSDFSGSGNIMFRVRALSVGGGTDRFSVSYIKLSYPAAFNMTAVTEQILQLKPVGTGKSYVEFTNSAAGTRLFDVTDPSNIVVIGTRTSGPILSAVVAGATTSRKLLYTTVTKSVQQSQLKRVTFRHLEQPADFIIVSHPLLTAGASGYPDPVQAYADYRSSQEGGEYNSIVVMIDELYDQFSYGEKSPVAIKEFMRMMTGIGNPKYLFLIGKGRELLAQYWRRVPLAGELPDLVPTAGTPASDLLYTVGQGPNALPAIPVGRLPAVTSSQVAAYLNKIKETEAVPAHSWQKRVLHLSGGIQPGELSLFRTYVQGFEEIAKRRYLGADVSTLGKHSVSPVEFINISEEVNAGVNIVTFFGHSSSNATDIDIGKVTDPVLGYDNKGKYPILLVNGCYAGEFFNNGVNFGEDWILAGNKGARNFMANSSFGLDGVLKLYSDLFYEMGFGDSARINMGVGDVQVAIAKVMIGENVVPTFNSAQVHQVVLLGDPSVKLMQATVPDFTTSDGAISVSSWDGKPIHAMTDSLRVSVIVANQGKVNTVPLSVRLIQTTNEGVSEVDTLFSPLLSADTIHITVRRGNGNFFGSNKFEVILDALNEVDELNEENNHAIWTKLINFNGTQNLQPAPFGIVSSPSVDLVFMDTDMAASQKTYDLEIDTAATFNSPFKISRSVTAKVLARSNLNMLPMDSLVYYWRTKPTGVADVQWESTSFAFIRDGGPGFAQLNFEQLSSNTTNGLVPDPELEKLSFEETSVSFFVRNFGSEHPSSAANGSFQVNNAEYYISPQQFDCRNNTINLVAFDRSSVVPYLGIPFTFQNSFGRSCGREPMIINSFDSTEVATGNNDDLIRYIDNIEPGDSVVLFSMGDAGFRKWSVMVKQKLGEFGIAPADIDTFLPGEPVIILGKKGATVGTARIIRATGANPEEQELQLAESIGGFETSGSMRSVLVGPAVKWKGVSPQISEAGATDVVGVDAIGVGASGVETVLFTNQQGYFSLDGIDAIDYPYLRLQFTARDEVELTPGQLDQWIVNYDPAPDGLVMLHSPPGPHSVQEGTVFNSSFGFVNITNIPFTGTVDATLTLYNQASNAIEFFPMSFEGPAPGDTSFMQFDIATISKLGFNDLSLGIKYGGIEQYVQNNTLELPGHLNVIKDNFHPLLDVTVDGRYLVSGDLVAANPVIRISVMDENPLLGPLDTTALALFLTYPCTTGNCVAQRINFSGSEVVWSSIAGSPRLIVEFRPRDLANGIYELRVQGFDKSGNPSGEEPYQVSFEVKSDPSITYLPPYPNPSAGPVFFEFQCAGAQAPEGMVLQIFTREGREVTRFDETGEIPLRVGLNQFQWTGLDVHGGRISPGLYLYQLRVYQSGREYAASGRLMIIN